MPHFASNAVLAFNPNPKYSLQSLTPYLPSSPLLLVVHTYTHFHPHAHKKNSAGGFSYLIMENGAPMPANEGRDPSGFLSQIIGNPVTVKLNSGVVYKGE